VGELTIHLMLGKTLKKECMGGYGMLCVMRVLDEFESKVITNLVSFLKCIKRVLDEFLNVMPEEFYFYASNDGSICADENPSFFLLWE
jgi:hypothetical protein